MKTKWIGLGILLLVMVAVIGWLFFRPAPVETVNGYLGGEKIGLFEDPEFIRLMEKDHKLKLGYRKAGSIDMIDADPTGMSYLFPASQTALELYKDRIGATRRDEIALNTPLVLYTHKLVRDRLVAAGLITENGGSYYMDMQQFAQAIIDGKSWADLGLPELYGSLSVKTTDPTKSNSGNMFAGLVANSLNGGQVVGAASLDSILPELQAFFQRMGYMDTSSADLFSQFLKMGVGAYPMIAAYENQLLEFAVEHPEEWEQLDGEIVLVYPTPTVYSSHVLIALDEKGDRAIDAMMDPQIQQLAWTRHGFRTGVAGTQLNTDSFGVDGVPEQITRVMPMPDFTTMDRIIQSLQ
ncbi:MAG: hypothetical protein GX291_03495 [Tissierellia bacterium]|jgi:hypothetical protein|nr:hypothetical protein [Bacillota bacterium]NLK58323.1 hypothetical protein [Tissierellia bacterium]